MSELSQVVAEQSAQILKELNEKVCVTITADLLRNPVQARGLAKLLIAFSAVRFMSGVSKGKKDPFLDAGCEVLAMAEGVKRMDALINTKEEDK